MTPRVDLFDRQGMTTTMMDRNSPSVMSQPTRSLPSNCSQCKLQRGISREE